MMKDVEMQGRLLGWDVFHPLDLAGLYRSTGSMYKTDIGIHMCEAASSTAPHLLNQQVNARSLRLVSSILWSAFRLYQNIDPVYESLGERSSELLSAVASSHLEDMNRKRAPQHSSSAPLSRHVRDVEDIANVCSCLTRNKIVADQTGKSIKPLEMAPRFLEALEESADGIFCNASVLNPARRGGRSFKPKSFNQTSLIDILEAYKAFGVPCPTIREKAREALESGASRGKAGGRGKAGARGKSVSREETKAMNTARALLKALDARDDDTDGGRESSQP